MLYPITYTERWLTWENLLYILILIESVWISVECDFNSNLNLILEISFFPNRSTRTTITWTRKVRAKGKPSWRFVVKSCSNFTIGTTCVLCWTKAWWGPALSLFTSTANSSSILRYVIPASERQPCFMENKKWHNQIDNDGKDGEMLNILNLLEC